jgi:anti-sigma regulatory factor (Ser/Thr protein kinase)
METGKSTKKTAPVSYDMEIHEDHIELNFLNKGDIFDRSVYREPVLGEGQIGGYGLFLVRQLSDTLDYFHQGDENHWHIEKTFRRAVNAE